MRIGSLLILLWPLYAQGNDAGAIQIDGRLDERAWQQAERHTQFLTADPLSLETPAYGTEARVLARPEGLYIGVISQLPRSLRTYGRSPRDAATMDADSVRIVVDFEGRGQTAYEFTVSLSGSHRDGIFLNQTRVSYDWDGTWSHAVSEDDDNWYLEVMLPWNVAPLSSPSNDKRTLGLWLMRYVDALNRGYAFPAIEPTRPSFLADLHRFEVPAYGVRSLDLFPYVAATRDLLTDSDRMRAGLDLFWKPDAQKQLALTANPDFGQVESDDLVVNFTAIETFFSEKRPFFTEGQSLFDLRTTNEGRFINTRRIGAAPDAGLEGSTDILGAAKFTALKDLNKGALEYGAFAAVEDDSSEAEGRNYAALRGRYKTSGASLGYLGAFTERETLDRDAQVHVVDGNWVGRGGWSAGGQAIATLVDAPGSPADRDGAGAVLTTSYAPGGRWQEELNLTWFDRDFDINDLGYMQRGNLREVQSTTYWHTRQFSADSHLNATYWRINGRLKYNDEHLRLPATLEFGHYWRFRVPAGIYLYYYGQTSGYDDLIARDIGAVRLPERHEFGTQYQFDVGRRLSFVGEAYVFQEGLEGTAKRLILRPTWIPSNNINVGIDLDYIDSPDWLIWRSATSRLATHEREQLNAVLRFSWYPAPRHELRVKGQWIALRARVRDVYDVGAGGQLVPDATAVDDLSLSQIGVQLRYRYEIKPLSDFYVVYSRGGFDSEDAYTGGIDSLFDSALRARTAHQVLVKLRYRF